MFALRLGLWVLLLGGVIGIGGRVVSAVDAVRQAGVRPRWSLVLVGWGALIVSDVLLSPVMAHLKEDYRANYMQAFTIPSGSMLDTLLVGDYILVDKSVYRTRAPQRGDVVVFKYPQDERRDFIFRIIGTPGETVQVRDHAVLIDGRVLDEPYARRDSPAHPRGDLPAVCTYAYGCEPLVVPPDSYFVMGDNRVNSLDSRYWGFVKREKI